MLLALMEDMNELEWLALANYYDTAVVNVYVHQNGTVSEWFETKVGVKQGGPFSPTGFNKHIDHMIVEIKLTDITMTIRMVKGGIIVYADDTTIITRSSDDMHKAIATIVKYCLKYDIIINELKTQWLKIGDPVRESESGVPIVRPAMPQEDFKINGKIIEKVDRFKLLGIWTMSNGSHRTHITKRIKAAYAPVPGLNELGLNDPKMDPRIIGTLISSYVRPRLLYGSEAIELNEQEMRDLIVCEGKIIKRAMNIPYNCYNTQLYEMLEIQSPAWAMKKRKITFLKQLLENKITSKMLITRRTAMDYTLYIIGAGDQGSLSDKDYIAKLLQMCNSEISRINALENEQSMSDYTKVLRNLWRNREEDDNEDTLMLMFKSKNKMRELFETKQGDGG